MGAGEKRALAKHIFLTKTIRIIEKHLKFCAFLLKYFSPNIIGQTQR